MPNKNRVTLVEQDAKDAHQQKLVYNVAQDFIWIIKNVQHAFKTVNLVRMENHVAIVYKDIRIK